MSHLRASYCRNTSVGAQVMNELMHKVEVLCNWLLRAEHEVIVQYFLRASHTVRTVRTVECTCVFASVRVCMHVCVLRVCACVCVA